MLLRSALPKVPQEGSIPLPWAVSLLHSTASVNKIIIPPIIDADQSSVIVCLWGSRTSSGAVSWEEEEEECCQLILRCFMSGAGERTVITNLTSYHSSRHNSLSTQVSQKSNTVHYTYLEEIMVLLNADASSLMPKHIIAPMHPTS